MPASRRSTSVELQSECLPYWRSDCGRAAVYVGRCEKVLPSLGASQFHAVVTDPPYELGFMGHGWDSTGVAYKKDTWNGVLRTARPGAHLLSFGGTRTWHRMACAIEDAGWEIRDTIMWVYGTGFPKGLDISQAIDKHLGFDRTETISAGTAPLSQGQFNSNHAGAGGYGFKAEYKVMAPATDAARRWQGWNTALKPAVEPIVMARKPVAGTVAQCVLEHGTGALNIGGCKVGSTGAVVRKLVATMNSSGSGIYKFNTGNPESVAMNGDFLKDGMDGTYPTNFIHDDSDDVVALLPNDAARFFYAVKADKDDRPHGKDATTHPTVKPLDLMQYLVRLVCPRGGVVLDPFMGSGSTGCAAILEGMRFVGIEQSQEYADISVGRLKLALESSPGMMEQTTVTVPTNKKAPPPPSKRLRG